MRILTTLILLAIASISALGQEANSPPPRAQLTVAQREAREELNRAAAAYKDGDFAEAQRHSEKALALDPTSRVAPLFLARSIHTQYAPSNESPENREKGREAIAAYQRILDTEPTNEEAYKAVAAIYGSMREEELLRVWILQRASNPLFAADKRAEAYAILAGKDWDCSFKITELPENKLVKTRGSESTVVFKKPRRESDFQKAKACAASGLDMAEMSLALDPTLEAAWAYKVNLLTETAKLYEMEQEHGPKSVFLKLADEARLQAEMLSEKRRREQSEAESAESRQQQEEQPHEKVSDGDSAKEKIIERGDLDTVALSKPQLDYPENPKIAHLRGTVKVAIIVDESGRVISARAVGGQLVLRMLAELNARRATFTPTIVDGQPGKISGFLTYEFDFGKPSNEGNSKP
ncbi:MAG TPA: energy transducer TonB [Pyrinomonadaceae bacterium]